MSATAEGHNQPSFINSANRCGAVRFYPKWLFKSKRRICAVISLFLSGNPHAECPPLSKLLLFT